MSGSHFTCGAVRAGDPADLCLHEMVEAQAARTPDAVAVTCEGRRLTYRMLDEEADKLAAYLETLGVQAETPVGVYVERSPEMVVVLLGIMKAGGCYVPLDPSYRPSASRGCSKTPRRRSC